jgi:hypothetical protein
MNKKTRKVIKMANDSSVVDVYEEAYRTSLAELEELNNSDAVSASLEHTLSNTSDPTDYEAWSAGCAKFLDDNYDTLKKWVG